MIGTGLTTSIDGLSGTLASGDGTLTHVGEPLERGDTYSVVAYVPQPTPDQLREAPVASSERRFNGSTLLSLPSADGVTQAPGPAVPMPLWGKRDPTTTAHVLASPYGPTYRLARSWIADARTPYDAVRAIQDHLRGDYDYDPNVPRAHVPAAVLPVRRRVRLLPAVRRDDGPDAADGRDPGQGRLRVRARHRWTRASGTYEVHDTDAHSWVEAYFRGIGWVTFDPTPDAAPAESQRLGGDFAARVPRSGPEPDPADATGQSRGGRVDTTAPARVAVRARRAPGAPPAVIVLAVVCLAAGDFALVVVAPPPPAAQRRSDRCPGRRADRGAAPRRLANRAADDPARDRAPLDRVGARRDPRLRGAAACPPLRPGDRLRPGPAERRAVRRALSAGGLRRRLRMLVSIPPGGPRSLVSDGAAAVHGRARDLRLSPAGARRGDARALRRDARPASRLELARRVGAARRRGRSCCSSTARSSPAREPDRRPRPDRPGTRLPARRRSGSSTTGWRERLGAAGVEITHEHDWEGGRRSLYFHDPAGNLLEIADGDLWPR